MTKIKCKDKKWNPRTIPRSKDLDNPYFKTLKNRNAAKIIKILQYLSDSCIPDGEWMMIPPFDIKKSQHDALKLFLYEISQEGIDKEVNKSDKEY